MNLSDDLLKLSKIKYKNKNYQIFATKANKRIFVEVKEDGCYELPDLSIYLELDSKFNIQFTGKLYMILKRRIVSLLMAGVLIINLTFLLLNKNNYTLVKTPKYKSVSLIDSSSLEDNIEKDIEDVKFFNFIINDNDLIDAIDKNDNIDETNKVYFKKFVNEVRSVFPNLDLTTFYRNIKDIKVRVISSDDIKKLRENDVTNAYVDFIKGEIVFADSIAYETMRHELSHLLFNKIYPNLPIPPDSKIAIILRNAYISNFYINGMAFEEGCNAIMLEEIGSKEEEYYYDKRLVKLLCRIIGDENVFNIYRSQDKVENLIEHLSSIKGSAEEAKALIMKMDDRQKAENSFDYENEPIISIDICAILTDYYFASKSKKEIDNQSLETDIIDMLSFYQLLIEIQSYDSVYSTIAQKRVGVPEEKIEYTSDMEIIVNYARKMNQYIDQNAFRYDISTAEFKNLYNSLESTFDYKSVSKEPCFINFDEQKTDLFVN
ncbi:MAG TPA: hypothetical protein GXZ95_02640 [Mollicutes bacterium]|nr:hypothetical protein [Mollicutes bacterium]